MKKRFLPVAVMAAVVATLFATPIAAVAASMPDALCEWTGSDDIEFANPADLDCSPIQYKEWSEKEMTLFPVVKQEQMNIVLKGPEQKFLSPSHIAPESSIMTGGIFAVEPAAVNDLPVDVSTGVSIYGGSDVQIVDLYATVVGQNTWDNYENKTSGIDGDLLDASSFPNPYEGLDGEITQVVPEGTAFDVEWTATGNDGVASSYDVVIPFASPTFTVDTGDKLNAVGYVAAITAVVENTTTGDIYQVSQQHIYYGYSHYSPDLQALAPSQSECEVVDNQICGATGTFGINLSAYYADVEVELPTPPVVTPPTTTPPVVAPPVDVPPVVVDPPETSPPVINTGDSDDFSLFYGLGVMLTLGAVVYAAVRLRRA